MDPGCHHRQFKYAGRSPEYGGNEADRRCGGPESSLLAAIGACDRAQSDGTGRDSGPGDRVLCNHVFAVDCDGELCHPRHRQRLPGGNVIGKIHPERGCALAALGGKRTGGHWRGLTALVEGSPIRAPICGTAANTWTTLFIQSSGARLTAPRGDFNEIPSRVCSWFWHFSSFRSGFRPGNSALADPGRARVDGYSATKGGEGCRNSQAKSG